MLGSTRKNIDLLQKLVGQDALKCVTLGTTKWDLIREEVGVAREVQLKGIYWAEMIKAGSTVCRIKEGETLPVEVVNALLERVDPEKITLFEDDIVLKIQNELVNLKKFIPETDVGKALKYNLQDAVKIQIAEVQRLSTQVRNSEDPKLREELDARRTLLESLQESQKMLHIPLAHRARRFLALLSMSLSLTVDARLSRRNHREARSMTEWAPICVGGQLSEIPPKTVYQGQTIGCRTDRGILTFTLTILILALQLNL